METNVCSRTVAHSHYIPTPPTPPGAARSNHPPPLWFMLRSR